MRLLAKRYFIGGDVLNSESEGSAQSHNNCLQKKTINFEMLITFERKLPERSDASHGAVLIKSRFDLSGIFQFHIFCHAPG